MNADLATVEGVDELCSAANGRAIDALLANAGRGLGNAFLDQRGDDARRVNGTNVTGTVYLLHKVGNEMRTRGDFFERADMLDTRIGQSKKQDPAEVAHIGYDAMIRGAGDIVSGWQNKLRSAIALVTPSAVLAEMHWSAAEPGSAEKS